MASNVGPLFAFLAACTWAVGTTVYARVSRHVPGAAVNATRALVALPVFLLVLAMDRGPGGAVQALGAVPPRSLALLALSTLASYGLGDLLFLASARRIGVPAALAIACTYPLWAALGGAVLLGEGVGLVRGAGVAAVVTGTSVVILAGLRGEGGRGDPRLFLRGVLLAAATSLLWALNGYGVRAAGMDLPPVVTTTVRLALGLLLCPIIGWVTYRRTVGSRFQPFVSWPLLRPALWAFLVEAVAGTFLFVWGLSRSPLVVGTAMSSLAPVVSVPLAWIMRTERPSVAKALGIVVVCAGVVLLVLAPAL